MRHLRPFQLILGRPDPVFPRPGVPPPRRGPPLRPGGWRSSTVPFQIPVAATRGRSAASGQSSKSSSVQRVQCSVPWSRSSAVRASWMVFTAQRVCRCRAAQRPFRTTPCAPDGPQQAALPQRRTAPAPMVRSAALAFGTLFRRIGPGVDTRRRAWRSGRGRSGGAAALRKKRRMRRKPSLGRARPSCRRCRGRHALARHRRPVHGRPGGRVRREVRRATSFASFASFARTRRYCRAEAGQPSCQTSCRAARHSFAGRTREITRTADQRNTQRKLCHPTQVCFGCRLCENAVADARGEVFGCRVAACSKEASNIHLGRQQNCWLLLRHVVSTQPRSRRGIQQGCWY